MASRKTISSKLFKNLIISATHLYGCLTAYDFYLILQRYFEKITEEEVLNELDKYWVKPVSDFMCVDLDDTKTKYLIAGNFLEPDEIERLMSEAMGKPLYFPPTLEDFLSFQVDHHCTDIEDEIYTKIMRFLMNICFSEDKEYESFIATSYIQISIRMGSDNSKTMLKKLKEHNFDFSKTKTSKEFKELFEEAFENTKTYINRGYSKKEMDLIFTDEDLEVNISEYEEHILDLFRNNTVDPYEYIDLIETSNFKEDIKNRFVNLAKEYIKSNGSNEA